MGAPSILPLLLFGALAVIAAFALRRGLRWRIEAIPQTCRRCGYDVSKRPADATRCSECGADLTLPRATTTIRRSVNRRIAIPAAVILVVALAAAFSAVMRFSYRDWFRANAPIGWIQSLARGDPGVGGDPYRSAWRDRAPHDGHLDHLLDLYEDPNVPWRPAWGNVLSDAFAVNTLSVAQRDRYLSRTFGPTTFRARSPVRVGDPLAIEAILTTRGDPRRRIVERHAFAARADGVAEVADRYWSVGGRNATQSRAIAWRDWAGDAVAPGRHRVSVKLRRQAARGNGPSTAGGLETYGPAVDGEATLDVDVLPADAPLGEALPDTGEGEAIARATSVGVYHWHDGRCFAEVRLLPASVDRAFTAYATIDGVERRIGRIAARSGAEATTNAVYVPLDVPRARATETLTIVLAGDDDALVESVDQHRYWPGRIVFPDVPLRTFDEYVADSNGPRRPTASPFRVEPATRPVISR